jgi:DNA modification methylase
MAKKVEIKTELIAITKIKSNPNNPRVLKDDKFKKLVQSIKDFPKMLEIRPIVVNNDMVVLGGNMRLKACKEVGLKEIPIIKAADLTEEQQREFIIKDNVGFGEWDWDIIANEWDAEQLDDWGLDMPFDFGAELEAEEDDYEMPDEIKTDIVLGDLIEIGEHRLLCGDSTDADQVAKLMDGEMADMVFTSPPYNGNTTMYDYVIVNGQKKRKDKPLYQDNETDNKSSSEYIDFCNSVMNLCFLHTYGYIFWNINYNAKSRFEYIETIYPYKEKLHETIIWKKNAIPTANGLTRNFEFIFMLKTDEEINHLNKEYDVTHNVWDINNIGSQHNNHKACFPVELPSKAISLNERTKLLFEPFTGSGSTMVAAHQLKRKCYGMELDPKYCQVIVDRMMQLDESLTVKINGAEYKK